MSSQLVSLVWDGHHKTLVSVFEKLLVNSHFVDCTIAAEGQRMKAHKEVLCTFSPFFELLFKEETEKNPTVIISGISFRDLRSLVDFMYQGRLEVTEDRIQDLIDAAECLQIDGLGGVHIQDDSGNIKNIKVLHKNPVLSSGIPHKRTRKGESGEAASVDSKESKVNNLNYSNEIRPENSVVITCRASQSSTVQNLRPNSDVRKVGIVSNTSLKPSQSTQSEIEMDNLHLQDEFVIKKEPDSDGDDNINEPMRDGSRGMLVCGNSYESSGEETIDGLSADISVPSETNVYGDFPLDCVLPATLSSQSCSRDLTGSSVKNELCNINVNLSSESVDPVEPTVDTQDPLFHSEFHIKTADETLSSVDNDLISGHGEFPENMPQGIGVRPLSDMRMQVACTGRKNDCSGAASGCISESAYSPQENTAAFVKIERSNEPALGLMPGLSVEVNPHDILTHPSHTTPVCDRDMSGPFGRDVSSGSSSAEMYWCQICNKTFTQSWIYNVHMRVHAEERLFRYDKRDYAAVTSVGMNEHQHNQSERKLYKCTECEYSNTRSSHMKRHQRIHSGLKPYKCAECGYTAAQLGNLKTHERIHSGVKPYKCTECEFTSAYGNHLKRHQRTHFRSKH